jgi:phage terminase small subunit
MVLLILYTDIDYELFIMKRQALTIQYFTDTTNKETYKNWSKSMIKAGYSEAYTRSNGYKLRDKVGIKEKIAENEAQQRKDHKVTRQLKIDLSWKNFLNAKTDTMRKFWWEEHGKLSQDYVTKTETKSETVIKDQQADEVFDMLSQYDRNNN